MRSVLFIASSLTLALASAGLASASGPYYNPANAANSKGVTDGTPLYRTIGCPGRQLLDPPCMEDLPAPAPVVKSPAPVVDNCPLPLGALAGDKMPTNAQAGQSFTKVFRPASFRTETNRKLVKEASERI